MEDGSRTKLSRFVDEYTAACCTSHIKKKKRMQQKQYLFVSEREDPFEEESVEISALD